MKITLTKKAFTAIFSFLILGMVSCELEKVDPIYKDLEEIVDFRTDEDFCDLYLMGTILDANTQQPIPDAEIKINFLSIISDDDGNYKVKVNAVPELMMGNQIIGVFKDGYTFSTLEVDFNDYIDLNNCNRSRVSVELDFVLTARNNPISVGPSGGSFTIVDTTTKMIVVNGIPEQTIVIDTINIEVPEGALENNTSITVTAINDNQYLGSFSEEDLGFIAAKRLDFQPDGINFLKPIVITTSPNIQLSSSNELVLLSLNTEDNPLVTTMPETNKFRREASMVNYDPINNRVSVAINHFSAGVVGIENGLRIEPNDEGELEPVISQDTILNDTIFNCNCSEGMPYTKTINNNLRVALELTLDAPVPFEEIQDQLLSVYNLLRTSLNLPTVNSNSIDGMGDGTTAIAYFPAVVDDSTIELNGFVEKCDVEILLVNAEIHTYTGTALGYDFVFKIPNQVERKIENQVCPITTSCHQGCN